MGDLALQLQRSGNVALSTKPSRAVTEHAIVVELEEGERDAIVAALAEWSDAGQPGQCLAPGS